MAYVPGFLHDVFISYACADDAQADGLIGNFRSLLMNSLRAQGLRMHEDQAGGVDVFLDRSRLQSGDDLTEQILTAARCSAVFIAFHSPAYVESRWCRREAEEFSGIYDSRRPKLAGRLFVVSLGRSGSPSDSPVEALRSRRFRRFFYLNQDGLDFPFEPAHPQRPPRINQDGYDLRQEAIIMAREIAETLKAMHVESPVPRVFLADTSDAGREKAEDIKRWLLGKALVLRASPGGANWEQECRELIAQSDLFVDVHESAPPDAAAVQARLATELNKPRVRWLPRGELSQEASQALMAETKLLEGRLEDFKLELAEMLTQRGERYKPPPPPPPQPPPNGGQAHGHALSNALVLLIGASKDEAYVSQIEQTLDNFGCGRDAFLSEDIIENPDSGSWRQKLQSLLSLHEKASEGALAGVVFVDGDCRGEWVDQRLRDLVLLLSDAAPRTRPALCIFPPPDKRRHYRPPATRVRRYDGTQLDKLRDLLQH